MNQAAVYGGLRIVLALVLMAAAELKVSEMMGPGGRTDRSWRFPLTLTMSAVEFVAGVWLAWGCFARITRLVALIGFAGLAAVSLYNAVSGQLSCGCFGRLTVNPWITFAFDLIAVACLACLGPGLRGADGRLTSQNALHLSIQRLGCALGCVLAASLAVWMVAPRAHFVTLTANGVQLPTDATDVLLDPQMWVGRQLPLLPYLDQAAVLSRGEWSLLLYHHDCSRCQEALGSYVRRAVDSSKGGGSRRKMAVVELPPFGPALPVSPKEAGTVQYARLSSRLNWFATTPAEIQVDDGVVLRNEPGLRQVE